MNTAAMPSLNNKEHPTDPHFRQILRDLLRKQLCKRGCAREGKIARWQIVLDEKSGRYSLLRA